MLEKLFSSRVRTKLIKLFFLSPGTGYNALEITQFLGETYSAVWKELVHLEKAGILTSEPKGNAKIYRVNSVNPIAPELYAMVLKTEGVGNVVRQALASSSSINAAFIFGSYASGSADANSDLDLMVIGEVNLEQFSTVISQLESELRRPVNYVIYTEQEWENKVVNREPFALNVKEAPKIFLIGGADAL